VTLERKDGKGVTLAINEQTKIRTNDGSLDAGDTAVAFSREAKSDTSITLERPDGVSVTLKIDENTKIRKEVVKVGDKAVAMSGDGTALIVLAATKPSKSGELQSGSGSPGAPLIEWVGC
jgi:hypothetical protein